MSADTAPDPRNAPRTDAPPGSRPSRRWYQRWYVLLFVLAIVIVAGGIASMGGGKHQHAFRMPSISMEPAIMKGDWIVATMGAPDSLARGEVVLYRASDGAMFPKRIVAVPGDTVAMRHFQLLIDGRPMNEPYAAVTDSSEEGADDFTWQRRYLVGDTAAYAPTTETWGPLRVPDEHYFLLGDRRDESYDSRYRGFIARADIVGRPTMVYFSRDADSGTVRWSRIGMKIH